MLLLHLLLLLLLLLPISSVNSRRTPPRYKIDLDEHPSQRWNQVITDHLEYLPGVVEETNIFGLGCTSIVAQNSKGEIFHGRNLDYDMTGLLKNITVFVDFVRNGSVVYSGVTFALYNGVLTGQRPGAYSVSLNARYSGAYIDNILMELFTKFKRPVSFFIRDVLENQKTYEEAVNSLSNTHLFSPSYIIVAGTKKNEGVVISRNRWSAANIYPLNMESNQWFLVETNYDNWAKQGDNRRITAIRKLKSIGKERLDEKKMEEVLSTVPVTNNLTVFSTVISPKNPSVFADSTWIWD
uniref:Ceramidase n=1 Tax=Caenorhabditis tropicalis TaxID=1561998 RepID=A0A1I7U8V1_9PELO